MKVIELLNEKTIVSELKGISKKDVINELINLFKDDERIKNLEKVREAIFEREMIMSTGVGKGFALPHGKTDAVNDIIAAFGKTKNPIDYEALDHQPVHLVFLLVGRDNMVSTHIKLLSRISRMMNKDEFRERLLQAETVPEILNMFSEEEKNYFEV